MRPLTPPSAAALVFCTSAAVLVLEILAVRLLAPYVGLTLETYTTVIGVVLAGIALGSWAGGRAADRTDPRTLLGPLLVAGGLLAAATVPLVRLLGEATDGTAAEGMVVLGLFGFLPPAAVLSAVSPVVVKLSLTDLAQTGDVVGRLSAIGTAGALTGTFLTGFVLVSALPNAPIIIGIGIALALAGCLIQRSAKLVAVALLAALALAGVAAAAGRPCEVESAYFCARVAVDPADPSGRTLYLDDLRHAYVDLDDPRRLELRYARLIGDALDRRPPGPVTALHLGGGGFTLPRYLIATRPGSRNQVLEVDDEVPPSAGAPTSPSRPATPASCSATSPTTATTSSSATRSARSRCRGTWPRRSSPRSSSASSSPAACTRST
jgi:MFS family permease